MILLTPSALGGRQILELLAEGLTNREIGEQIGVSLKGVDTHVSNVLDRMEARSRANAVHLAWRAGLLGREVGA